MRAGWELKSVEPPAALLQRVRQPVDVELVATEGDHGHLYIHNTRILYEMVAQNVLRTINVNVLLLLEVLYIVFPILCPRSLDPFYIVTYYIK